MYKKIPFTVLVAMIGIAACNNPKKATDSTAIDSAEINKANFDTTVKPQNDFYHYVNGNWLKNNPIPPSEVSWGSFNEVHDRNQNELHQILDSAAADKNAKPGSDEQKIGDYFASGMDSVKLNKDGMSPLKSEFAMIDNIKNTKDLISVIAHEQMNGVDVMFSFGVGQDPKHSDQMITQFYQGGLGLPDRDYYLSPAFEGMRAEYSSYLANMFGLMGDKADVAKKEAATVIKIETELAKASMTRVEMRNVEAQYNKKTLKELITFTPNIDWNAYLSAVNINNADNVIVAQLNFYSELNNMFKSVPINDWKTYLRFDLLNSEAAYLSDSIEAVHFNFYGSVLYGVKVMQSRWKRVLASTDRALGDALGKLYVEKYFTANAKKRVNEMIDNLIATYKERINSRDWMTDSTKKKAIAKLNVLMRKVGYPDKWKDYSSLDINRDSYVENHMRADVYAFKYDINKLGKPVDRTEWDMTPPTINAYYDPSMNEIVFPAGIMQPPFFDPNRDDAMNYGAMGAIIGHEITHGFDDQGSQYDPQGNLHNWWTKEDSLKFKAKTNILVKQFSSYIPIDTTHMSGELTLGENIADLGGLTISYHALQRALKEHPEGDVDGFTPNQRFFISWAQGWRNNIRPQALKQQIKTNPHSPSKFRVNGPLSNMTEFYKAFNVVQGDSLYRPKTDRAEIW
ncbi:MAG TPA: M13 family metallopeptidase [Bacteroidia bacterium]|nr:M13 family metallopeptidase [Bacteroidia bacterium]